MITSLKTQEFIVSLQQRKLPIDPYSKDKQAHLDIDTNQDHLNLVKSFLNTDPH